MIFSPSHTLEYKPNDIIITSSIGDVLLHHPKYQRPYVIWTRLHLQRFGRWSLGTNRMRASMSRCVITQAMRGPDSREEGSIWNSTWSKTQRANTARVLPVALSYVASSLAEPRLRIFASLRSFAEQRYLARCVALRVAIFLTQGSIACKSILGARICTAVRTGAKRGTHFVSVLYTYAYGLYSPRTLGNSILGWRRRSNKHAICFNQVKKERRQVNAKFFELKGTYRDCRKSTGNKLG